MKNLIKYINRKLFAYSCNCIIDELKKERDELNWNINVDKHVSDANIVKLHNNDKKLKQIQKVKELYCGEPKVKKCKCKLNCSECKKN